MEAARRAAEAAARTSYGRLLAFVAARSRDLAAAEDALADAFRLALETWPRDGVPDRPEAWLLSVARRRLSNLWRARGVADAAETTLTLIAEESEAAMALATFPDERLKLLFVCAHPAIDPAVRTPLMLQTVLGLDAARIASAFLTAPAAMSQRLVRAKAKIRDAGVPFSAPDLAELPERLEPVLEAVYATYGTGWDDAGGADPRSKGLTEEALFLSRLIADLLPDQPEAHGLAALILHCEARRPARRTAEGDYIPLSEQDATLWSRPLITEAEAHLAAAARLKRPGRFQLEAAIQSAHAFRAASGVAPWSAIVGLYDSLLTFAPTLGAAVARAVAVGEAFGARTALLALDDLADEAAAYQPYWAARAHWEAAAGETAAASAAFDRATALSEDPAVRAFLSRRRALLA